MDNFRLKVKIGSHEFDAEGPKDLVREQFETFKELVSNTPVTESVPATTEQAEDAEEVPQSEKIPDLKLNKIMQVEHKVVSLTAPAKSAQDAALLLIYGQKVLRQCERVTGAQVMEGMRLSGLPVGRVDRLLDKARKEGDLIIMGQRRAKRYRITNKGINQARDLAQALLDMVVF